MQSRLFSLVLLDQILDLLLLINPHLEQLQILLVLCLFNFGELLFEAFLLEGVLVNFLIELPLLLIHRHLLLLLLL